MGRVLRDGSGATLLVGAIGLLFWAVVQLREHDYVAAVLLIVAGLSVLRAGVELLRPTLGE
jgi:hypothetical protein